MYIVLFSYLVILASFFHTLMIISNIRFVYYLVLESSLRVDNCKLHERAPERPVL